MFLEFLMLVDGFQFSKPKKNEPKTKLWNVFPEFSRGNAAAVCCR